VLRVIQQERSALTRLAEDVRRECQEPDPQSPRGADVEWLHRQDKTRVARLFVIHEDALSDHLSGLVRAADEHATALELIIRSGESLAMPLFALVRAVHEAALNICWLLDPNIAPAVRNIRAAVATLSSFERSVRALEDFPFSDASDLGTKREAMHEMRSYLEAAGFVLTQDGRGRWTVNVKYEAEVQNVKFDATSAADQYTPGVRYLWTVGSGAAHSMQWFAKGVDPSHGNVDIAAVVSLLDVVDGVVDVVSAYVQIPADQLHRKTHMRRAALLGGDSDGRRMKGYDDYARDRDRGMAGRV
jgi:hypothetical protein